MKINVTISGPPEGAAAMTTVARLIEHILRVSGFANLAQHAGRTRNDREGLGVTEVKRITQTIGQTTHVTINVFERE